MKIFAPKDLYATTGPSSIGMRKGEIRTIGQTLGLKAVECGAVDISNMDEEQVEAIVKAFEVPPKMSSTPKITEQTIVRIPERADFDAPAPIEEDEDSDTVVEDTENTHVSELLDSLKMTTSDAEDVTVEAIPEELVVVVAGMEKIVERDNINEFRDDGQPKATIVNKEVGRVVPSEEREAAWEIVAKRIGRK